jgi:hypothetical protein
VDDDNFAWEPAERHKQEDGNGFALIDTGINDIAEE